jgi:hypothetical protein
MRAHNDIIELVTDMTLGRDPTSADFGGIHLSAGPGSSTHPYGMLPSVAAHSSYWQPGNPAMDNVGAVIDGLFQAPVKHRYMLVLCQPFI